MVLLITYDLHLPNRDYSDVISKIKSFGSCVHDEESVWLVDTTKSTEQCRDELKGTTEDATFFVVEISQNWASLGLDKDVEDWLKSRQRKW